MHATIHVDLTSGSISPKELEALLDLCDKRGITIERLLFEAAQEVLKRELQEVGE